MHEHARTELTYMLVLKMNTVIFREKRNRVLLFVYVRKERKSNRDQNQVHYYHHHHRHRD